MVGIGIGEGFPLAILDWFCCWVTMIFENADLIREEEDRVGDGDGMTIVGLLLLPKVSSEAASVDPSHEKSSGGQQWWLQVDVALR